MTSATLPRPESTDSITAALDAIGDRWSLLVLRSIFAGNHRFAEIVEATGISTNLLTNRLGRLVDNGVVQRVPYQDRPVRHDYRLTTAGLELSPVLISLLQWGERWGVETTGPTLVHAECGGPIENRTVCTSCGDVVSAQAIRRRTHTSEAIQ